MQNIVYYIAVRCSAFLPIQHLALSYMAADCEIVVVSTCK